MTALSCRRRRLLNAARREREVANESPRRRELERIKDETKAKRLRKEAARL